MIRKSLLFTLISIVAFLAGFGCHALVFGSENERSNTVHDVPSVVSCLKEHRASFSDQNGIIDLQKATDYCAYQIQLQNKFNEFNIRRIRFLTQNNSDPILLWFVIAITASGIALAALQLAASYQLARHKGEFSAQDAELQLSQDKIVLKSSVTGLFILVMSFAFFIIFILYVYKIDEVNVDPKRPSQLRRVIDDLAPGGIGEPPKN